MFIFKSAFLALSESYKIKIFGDGFHFFRNSLQGSFVLQGLVPVNQYLKN